MKQIATLKNPYLSRRRPLVTYEAFMWIGFFTITILAIVDRFVWNVWPRQTFTIGSGSAGSDRMEGFKPGPWSVVLYDILARVSGRFSIVCYNFLLITRLKSLEYWLVNSFVSCYLLDCSNIVHANNRLHNYTGIGLCVLTLLHIWSILFPCITHGYTAKMVVGVWEWPLSERKPIKCSVVDVPGCWPDDANNDLKQMSLQGDDVFRLVEMTLFLMILIPLSIKWLASRWHAAIQLHRLINLVYFVDIVRRHTHPHSWVLNTPVFCIYLWDAYIWSNYWHRNKVPPLRRVILSEDYMVLYWISPFVSSTYIAPHYSMIMKKSSALETKHIFTCFENRLNCSLPHTEEKFEWNTGCVIRVFHDRLKPHFGNLESVSHTQRMFEEDPRMIITGPIPGEMSLKLQYALESDKERPIVLIGAGSAVNYILDFLLWLSTVKINETDPVEGQQRIKIIYTTRDVHLFQWSVDSFATITSQLDPKLSTCIDVKLSQTLGELNGDVLQTSIHSIRRSTRSLSVFDERINMYDEIEPGCKVFFQGNDTFKASVKGICMKVKASFHGGEGGY